MKVSEVSLRYASGYIVIDARNAPTLRNAIGSRIWLRRNSAENHLRQSQQMRPSEAHYFHVVPVEGKNDAFAMDHIDATGIVIGENGFLAMEALR